MAPETLTPFDRLQLINQFRILEKLDPSNAEDYVDNREILEHGYTILYEQIFGSVWDELSMDRCKYVFDVLHIHRDLLRSYKELSDKAGIKPGDLKFRGFDGNNESHNLAFAEYLQKTGKWEEILKGDLNSHSIGTVHRYPKMLEKWQHIGEQHGIERQSELTADEIKDIIS